MHHFFKRLLSLTLAAALCAALLTGCSSQNTITVFSEGDYLDPILLAAFTEETGIKVNYITGRRTPSAEEKAALATQRSLTDGDAERYYTSADAVLSAENTPSENDPYAGLTLREVLLSTRLGKEETLPDRGDVTAYEDADPAHTAVLAETNGNAEDKERSKELQKYQAAAYDVVLTDSDTLLELSECGLLLPLSETDIPNLANINPDWKDQTNHPERAYSATCLWETMCLLWNTRLVDEHQKSWNILWSEKYAGQLLMPVSQRDCLSVALTALGYDANSTDPDEIAAAWEKLSQQTPLAYTGGSAYTLMEQGLAAVMPCGSGDALAIMQQNPDLAFTLPAEGGFRISFGLAVTADSTKSDKAKLFVDYMCDATNLAKNAVYSKYSVTSDLAVSKLDSSWQSNPLAYPPGSFSEVAPVLTGHDAATRAACAVEWAKLTAKQ